MIIHIIVTDRVGIDSPQEGVAHSLAGTEGFEQSRRERKMRFAHLKRILRLGRLQLRGPRSAHDEFVLAFWLP